MYKAVSVFFFYLCLFVFTKAHYKTEANDQEWTYHSLAQINGQFQDVFIISSFKLQDLMVFFCILI